MGLDDIIIMFSKFAECIKLTFSTQNFEEWYLPAVAEVS